MTHSHGPGVESAAPAPHPSAPAPHPAAPVSREGAPRSDGARVARAALTRLVEPGDELAVAVVAALGPERALAVLTGRERLEPAERDLVADHTGDGTALSRRWSAGLARWAPRSAALNPERDLIALHRLGGGLLIPEDQAWPAALEDLGSAAPLGLWFRGAGTLPSAGAALAVVGSREATAYGRAVTERIAQEAVQAGVCVVSGGAYGVDGAAHRAALLAWTSDTRRPTSSPLDAAGSPRVPTVAVLAGGLDRFYPAGNEELLRAVMEHGLLVSEMPPGASPTRYRFLHRNRLIAALAGAVVVVEARWRSGAQNTAGHALGLGRELGVVPGPITSAASAGCHRLLQETPARLIAEPAQALQLLRGGPMTVGAATASSPGTVSTGNGTVAFAAPAIPDAARPTDGLNVEELLVCEALPVRQHVSVDRLVVTAGLALPTVLAVLSRLERRGLAERSEDRWRRAAQRPPASSPPRMGPPPVAQ